VQGFYAAVKDFREAGEAGDLLILRPAASRDFCVPPVEKIQTRVLPNPGEFDDTGPIGNTDNCTH